VKAQLTICHRYPDKLNDRSVTAPQTADTAISASVTHTAARPGSASELTSDSK